MAQSKQSQHNEEEFLPVVAKVATGVFGVAWILGIALLAWRTLPLAYGRDGIPLHYNIYVGIDHFGPWWMLFEVSLVSIILAAINALLTATVLKRRPMLALAVWGATLFVGAVALLALVRIVLINLAYG